MPSVFNMVTRKVVRELNENGDLIPIKNLIDADKFHCCSLVCKKKSFFPFFKPHYWKTGLTVDDLLEASDELDCVFTEVSEKKNSRIKDKVKMKMKTEMNIPHITSVNGEVDFSSMLELKLKFWEISQEGKESLSQRKLKKKMPSLVEALKKRGENLYMVIETVELAEEQNVERKYFVDTSFKSLIMKIEGGVDVSISSAITIPSKSVLACRINLLVFEEKHCRISHFDDKNSFSPESDSGQRSARLTEEWPEPLESFSDLQEKVKNLIWALQDLTDTERKAVLDFLARLLQDKALEEVEGKVAMALFTEELRDPENPLLSVLFDASGSSMQNQAEGILDFLEALTELKEEQQKILAKVVEEGLLSETMKLVEDLLKQSETFPLKADSITHTLVRICDPECKLEQPVTWDSETCHSLCALYTVLSVLMLLAQGPSSVL